MALLDRVITYAIDSKSCRKEGQLTSELSNSVVNHTARKLGGTPMAESNTRLPAISEP